MNIISLLPGECISHIISCTTPRDACRSTLVSCVFRTAADSDIVWERFLPRDYKEIISKSLSSSASLNSLMSKKDLYFHLCNNPIIIGNGHMSFALEKRSGKKCYMIGARGLSIIWGDTPRYWKWITLPESRFSEVAQLRAVWWLDIKGYIDTRILSPRTTYAAYLVYQLPESERGFEGRSIRLCIIYEQGAVAAEHCVILDPTPPQARNRGDGWMEIEMGEFFIGEGDNATVECSLRECSNYHCKSGLIVEGIEFRPKDI